MSGGPRRGVVGIRPEIVCLLPVRNAAAQLTGWLQDASDICDAVVALDDGSTDETSQILSAHPLVRIVLANPRRLSYLGWHDGDNRNRLLSAAADLDPRWVLFLDADERIDRSDAKALRSFVATNAIQGCVYGFQCFRMIGADRYDPAYEWTYRLFAYRPGQRLANDRFVRSAVPVSTPPFAPIPTTLRIQHFAEVDAQASTARVAMYREADPEHAFASVHPTPREKTQQTWPRWQPRVQTMPTLALPSNRVESLSGPVGPETIPGPDVPVLSTIVLAGDVVGSPDEATVRSLLAQVCPEPIEVILVVKGAGIAARLERAFPDLPMLDMTSSRSRTQMLNAGVAAARGEFVLFVEAAGPVAAGTASAVLAAHDQGYAMVAGEMDAPTSSSWCWAGYFMDHASSLPKGLVGRLELAPGCCSYAREPLLQVGGFPRGIDAPETVVSEELLRLGWTAWREPNVRFGTAPTYRSGLAFLGDRLRWGRALGRMAVKHGAAAAGQTGGQPTGLAPAAWFRQRSLPRLAAMRRHVLSADAVVASHYRQALPLVLAGELATSLGAGYELARANLTRRREVRG